MSDQGLDVLFGELRALLARDLTRDYMEPALLRLLELARAQDPVRYDAYWLPYLEANHERLPEVLGRFDSAEALARGLALLPASARVRFKPRVQSPRQERAMMLEVARSSGCARIGELVGGALSLGPDELCEALSVGDWSGLRRIALPSGGGDVKSLARLGALPCLAQVWWVGLLGAAVSSDGLRALAAAPYTSALEGLSVIGADVGDGVVDWSCGRIRYLLLSGSKLSAAGIERLVRRGGLDGVEYLHLGGDSSSGDALARSLCEATSCVKHMGCLNLMSSGVSSSGLRRLLESPLGHHIESLCVRAGSPEDESLLGCLGAASARSSLRALTYSGPLSINMAHQLARAPALGGLRGLTLWSEGLGAEQLQALSQEPWFGQLERLALNFVGVGDEEALRRLFARSQLRRLDALELSGLLCSDEFLLSLASGASLTGLQHLEVMSASPLSRQVLQAWSEAACFPLHLRQKFAAWL